MKYLYITVVLICCFSYNINSQVAINTTSPQGVFHIDAKGNNTSALSLTELNDDFIVSAGGNVGIGAMPSATSNVFINGNLRINDGTAAEDYVLQSDANGNASWTKLVMGDKSMVWFINNSGFIFTGAEQDLIASNATTDFALEVNQIGAILGNDKMTVTVPKGQYLMTFNGDVNGYEWGTVRIRNATNNVLVKEYAYRNWLTGIGEYLVFEEDTKIKLTFTMVTYTAGQIPSFYLNAADRPNKSIYYRLSLFKLNI